MNNKDLLDLAIASGGEFIQYSQFDETEKDVIEFTLENFTNFVEKIKSLD